MRIGILIPYILCIAIIFYGVILYLNPYLWAKDEKTSSFDLWSVENNYQAYFYFNISSRAFITTNYPVTIQAKVVIQNLTLLQTINSKRNAEIIIIGTQQYPLVYQPQIGLLGSGVIELTFDGNNSYDGIGNVVFPNLGKNYVFTFWTTNSHDDSLLIFSMNSSQTELETRIPPVFSIEEGYAQRASYEQVSQSIGTSFVAIGIAGIAIVSYIHLESRKP